MIRKIIPTGNEELDTRLGGGYPFPNIILFEGDHGSGKSALAQQFFYGALRSGMSGLAIITEGKPREYLRSMSEIQIDATPYYLRGSLTIISLYLKRFQWRQDLGREVLPVITDYIEQRSKRYDIFLIDSLTQLFTFAPPETILNFISRLRLLASRGKGFLLTMHPNIVREELGAQIRGMCDGYIKVSNTVIGGNIYKVLSVIKMKGIQAGAETSITFDVDPAMGIKIIPIKAAKA